MVWHFVASRFTGAWTGAPVARMQIRLVDHVEPRRPERDYQFTATAWCSRFQRLEFLLPRRHEIDGLPAPARAFLVRVVEHELRGEAVDLVVHLRAEEVEYRLWVDQDTGALVLDHLVERLLFVRPSHGVLHAGAAALLDADAGA